MRVLITGASRGIGKATSEYFAQQGYELETPSRSELDLNNLKSVIDYTEKFKNVPLDSLINNAGINEITLLENATDETIKRMTMVNILAPMYLLRGSICRLRKSKEGRIINIGSIWAVVSKSGRSLYSTTKNAMHGLTNALAIELAEHKILVNTVCPGFTLTELTRQNNSDMEIKEISEQIPLKRMADPQEIAQLVYFLGSHLNTYITGQKITIDGGYTVK